MKENTLKYITFADVDGESPAERMRRVEKTKRKYNQMLEIICPSKDIRAFAKRIAKRKCPCDKCAYQNGFLCMVPYTDGYMEDMEIDPCYEGVLMFLRNEMGDSTDCGVMMKLRHDLDEANDAFCVALEATIAAAGMVSHYRDSKPEMRRFLIAAAEKMREDARKLLDEAISRKEDAEPKNDNRGKAYT
jgi:hypothetical protein